MEGGQRDRVAGARARRRARWPPARRRSSDGGAGVGRGVLAGQAHQGLELVAALLGALADEQLVDVGDAGEERRARGLAAQLDERLADLGLVEERAASLDPVGDLRGAQRLFEDHQLGVGAREHGLVGPRDAAGVAAAHGAGDGLGLVAVGRVTGHRRRHPGGPVGAQPRVVAEHGVGHRQDLGRRAVVVVEAQHGGAGEVLRELGEEADVGAVPAEDALVGVAHHAEVVAVAAPTLQETELGGVDVLELVDEEVTETPAAGWPRTRGRSPAPARTAAAGRRNRPARGAASRARTARRSTRSRRRGAGACERRRRPPARSGRARSSAPSPTRSRWRRRRAARWRCARAGATAPAVGPCARAAWAGAGPGRPSGDAAARRRGRGTCPTRPGRARRARSGAPRARSPPCA